MANCWPANYFISIHANANLNTAINGTELYIYRRYTQPNWLAEQILDGIGTYKRWTGRYVDRRHRIVHRPHIGKSIEVSGTS